jgi:DNA-binding CsgD family transcriptional regulator
MVKAPALTPIELKVIRLICKEHTSEEIGEKLGISKRTVEAHRYRIMTKIKKRSVVGIVMFAIKHGLFTIR